MLFLTGASSSIANSGGMTQDDPMKSLGGYVSISPVPNAALNSLFDLVSLKSIKDKTKETIAIALINKFNETVNNLSLKIVSDQNSVCLFKVAAVSLNNDYCMEYINNRYSQPMMAEFYDATFNPGSVDVEITRLPIPGEEVDFSPFDVIVQFSKSNYDDVIEDIIKAFNKTIDYRVKRLSEKVFRIERTDDKSIDKPFECSFLSSDNAEFRFDGLFKNFNNNEVIISKKLEPNEGIGIWLQREILNTNEKSDSEIISDYDKKITKDTIEEIELVISYNNDKNIEFNEDSLVIDDKNIEFNEETLIF